MEKFYPDKQYNEAVERFRQKIYNEKCATSFQAYLNCRRDVRLVDSPCTHQFAELNECETIYRTLTSAKSEASPAS